MASTIYLPIRLFQRIGKFPRSYMPVEERYVSPCRQCGVLHPVWLQGQMAEPVRPLVTDSHAAQQSISSVTRHPHPQWAQVCPFSETAVVVRMIMPPHTDPVHRLYVHFSRARAGKVPSS